MLDGQVLRLPGDWYLDGLVAVYRPMMAGGLAPLLDADNAGAKADGPERLGRSALVTEDFDARHDESVDKEYIDRHRVPIRRMAVSDGLYEQGIAL